MSLLDSDGHEVTHSPWLTIGKEYVVLTVNIDFGGRAKFRVCVDQQDGGVLFAMFVASAFVMTDSSIASNWSIEVAAGGHIRMGPTSWLVEGFWDAYLDDEDPKAIDTVMRELTVLLGS